jgi:hypothetical protein
MGAQRSRRLNVPRTVEGGISDDRVKRLARHAAAAHRR